MIKIDIYRDCLWIHTVSVPNDAIMELIRIAHDNGCDIAKGKELIKVYGELSKLYRYLYVISCQYNIYMH